MLAVASTLAQDTDTHNAVLSALGEAGGPLSDEILSVLEPPLRHVPLQQELVVGNMMMTHTPKTCAALKVGPDKLEVGGPLVNFNNGDGPSLQYACESLSSVRIGTIQQLPSGGIQGDVEVARAPTKSTASAIHRRIHGVDAGWLRLRNCRCNPYIEVQGRTMFDASKLMVNVSGAPLCSVEKPKSEKAHKKCGCYKRGASREGCGDHPSWPPGEMASPFLHVVVLSRKDPHGEWVKYPKDFFFKDQLSHLQLDLPNVVHATQIRLMFVCATNPDPDAMPGCFNPEIDAHRIIQIDVLTEVTDFRWDQEAKDSAKSILANVHKPGDVNCAASCTAAFKNSDVGAICKNDMECAGCPTCQINCTRVNEDPVFSSHFDQWQTPGDGQFAQDPHVEDPQLQVTVSDKQWAVFASKRSLGTHGYHVQKRLMCFESRNSQAEPKGKGKKSRRRASSVEVQEICCVKKMIKPLHKTADKKMLKWAAPILRNF